MFAGERGGRGSRDMHQRKCGARAYTLATAPGDRGRRAGSLTVTSGNEHHRFVGDIPIQSSVLRKQLRYAAVIGFLLDFAPTGSINAVFALQHVGDRPGLIVGWLFRVIVTGGIGAAIACMLVWLRWKFVHRSS
jgi:hypothetical protein